MAFQMTESEASNQPQQILTKLFCKGLG